MAQDIEIHCSHVEYHFDAKNTHKFWRCYQVYCQPARYQFWIRQWGRVGTVGQWKIENDLPQLGNTALQEKMDKGYDHFVKRFWKITPASAESYRRKLGLDNLHHAMNQMMGSEAMLVPENEIIRGLLKMRKELA